MSGNAMNRFSERVDILGSIAPTAANAAVGNHITAYADMRDYHRAFVLIHLGEPAQGATLNVRVLQATDTDGTGSKIIEGKTPEQMVAGDSGGYVGIEVQSEELDVDNEFHTLAVRSTVGTDTYYHSIYVFGLDGRYEPMDVSDYVELVT